MHLFNKIFAMWVCFNTCVIICFALAVYDLRPSTLGKIQLLLHLSVHVYGICVINLLEKYLLSI